MSGRRKVLLVDDHLVIVEYLEELLEQHGFEVVGKETGIGDALRLLDQRSVDVVLLGLETADAGGFGGVREMRSAHPEAAVVILSGSDDESSIMAALDEGAAAYVRYDANPQDLVTAVRQALPRLLRFSDRLVRERAFAGARRRPHASRVRDPEARR